MEDHARLVALIRAFPTEKVYLEKARTVKVPDEAIVNALRKGLEDQLELYEAYKERMPDLFTRYQAAAQHRLTVLQTQGLEEYERSYTRVYRVKLGK